MRLNDKATLIEIVDEVALRASAPYGKEGMVRMASLLVELKAVVWRITLASPSHANKVWVKLESKGVDMEWLITLVDDFCVHADWNANAQFIADRISGNLSWPANDSSLPTELKRLAANSGQIKSALVSAPWIAFLYLLTISNVVKHVPME